MCGEESAISPFWLLSLIGGLPDNGAFVASLQGGREYRGWGVDRHLTADLWDMKRAELHDWKKSKTPPRYPRPGAKKEGKPLLSLGPFGRKKKPKKKEG